MQPLLNHPNKFINSVGRNKSFVCTYAIARVCSILFITLQMFVFCGFSSKQYLVYGIEFFKYGLYPDSPNPMQSLFPNYLICEWSAFDINGNLKKQFKVCALPMNDVLKWFFLIIWLWMFVTFFLNIISVVYSFIAHSCSKGRKFVRFSCADKFLLYVIELNLNDEQFLKFEDSLLQHLHDHNA